MGSFLAKLKECFESINIQSTCVSTCCVKDADVQVEIEERKNKHKKHHHAKQNDDKKKKSVELG